MKLTTSTLFIASLAVCVAGQGGQVTQIADGQVQIGKAADGQQAVYGPAGSRAAGIGGAAGQAGVSGSVGIGGAVGQAGVSGSAGNRAAGIGGAAGQTGVSGSAGNRAAGISGAAGQAGAQLGSLGAPNGLPLDISAAAAQGQGAAARISSSSGSIVRPAYIGAHGNAAEHAQAISSAPGPVIAPSIPFNANTNAPPAGPTSGSPIRQIADGQVQVPGPRNPGLPGRRIGDGQQVQAHGRNATGPAGIGASVTTGSPASVGPLEAPMAFKGAAAAGRYVSTAAAALGAFAFAFAMI